MKLLYFARIRERIGCAEEEISLPRGVRDVAGLLDWLRSRGDNFTAALGSTASIRVAVNQVHARAHDRVSDSDEIALFPPVTGG